MYTTIIHPLRKAMNISMNEYAVLDTIYHLSNNTKYGGWAIISKQNLADQLDLSKQSILNIIESLIIKGYLIKDEKTKYLRSSDFYCDAIQNKSNWIIGNKESEKNKFISSKENLPSVNNNENIGKESLPILVKKVYRDGKESLPNNIYNNNINNNIIERSKKNFPKFHDDEFMDLFEKVINLDNWKSKTQQQLEFELKELKGFDIDYAKELVKHAIKMNYKSCSFPETKANYLNWKKNKESKELDKSYFIPKYNKS